MDWWPGYVNMISQQTPDKILQQHNHYLEFREADLSDAWIENMQEITEHNPVPHRQGYRCEYQIHFISYKGWKVYMMHTGCFASIPGYEEALPEKENV